MAILKLTSSGGGVLSVDTPSTASNFTSTLPGTTGTLHDENSTLLSSKLSGALPAIDGAALTGIASGGVSHLGTITTTSGTTQSLSSVNFSLYNQIWISTKNVGAGGAFLQFGLNGDTLQDMTAWNPTANGMFATMKIDLRTNCFTCTWYTVAATTSGSSAQTDRTMTAGYYKIGVNYRAVSSGNVTLSQTGQTFSRGAAEVYGIK